MKDFWLGFMVGAFAIGLVASKATDKVRSETLADAAGSGYMVRDGKAYRVMPVADEAAEYLPNDVPCKCTPGKVIDGVEWPGDCPEWETRPWCLNVARPQ
jgi:hypothetical protein